MCFLRHKSYNSYNETTKKSLLYMNSLLDAKKHENTIEFTEKFVNLLMKHGKKSKAYNILYKALKSLYAKNLSLKIKTEKNKNFSKLNTKNAWKFFFAKKLLVQAIENVQPSVEVRNVKVSGRTYQVPAIVSKKRQTILAIRWIIDFARKRKQTSNSSFSECLATELFDAVKKSGKAKQKKDMLHQLAESNRAYMRFKWW